MSNHRNLATTQRGAESLLTRLRNALNCALGKHTPNRDKVRRKSATHYVGTCRRCGVPIHKRHGFQWKAYRLDDLPDFGPDVTP